MDSVVFQGRWNAANNESAAAEMRSLARDIGFALPNMDGASLRGFLSALGPAAEATENGFARAFRTTAIEIVASYETALAALDAERSAESLVVHEGWHRILNELAQRPLGSTDLASVLQLSKSHVSRALGAMREADLVEVTPSTSGRERPHRLTGLGDRLRLKLNQGQTMPDGSQRAAERAEIADLAGRPLTSLSFKTARELTLYVALLYLVVDVHTSDEACLIDELGTLRELRRLLVDIPTGVYVATNFTPRGPTQEVLRLLRSRLMDTKFTAAFQQSLLELGHRLGPQSSSTALVWACLAADFVESHPHESVAGGLPELARAILDQHRTPLALWCRSKGEMGTNLPRLVAQMKDADFTNGLEVPPTLAAQLEKTRDAAFFFSDPSAPSLPLEQAPRMGLAKEFLKSGETIRAISIAGSDNWLSESEYVEANCQAVEGGATVQRLIVFDNPAQIRPQQEKLNRLSRSGVELRYLKTESAQPLSGQQELENILIWNERFMTTSRADGKGILDRIQINAAVEIWGRMWARAQMTPPSASPSRPMGPAPAGLW